VPTFFLYCSHQRQEVNDSSVIIAKLLSRVPEGGKLPHVPASVAEAEEEERWRLWVDAHLVCLCENLSSVSGSSGVLSVGAAYILTGLGRYTSLPRTYTALGMNQR
jgi:hypothetical protein